MSPEEKRQFEDMQRRLNELEKAQNENAIANFQDKIIVKRALFDDTNPGTTGVVDTNTYLKTTTIGVGGGTVTTLNAPENLIEYVYKGKKYNIPAYNPR